MIIAIIILALVLVIACIIGYFVIKQNKKNKKTIDAIKSSSENLNNYYTTREKQTVKNSETEKTIQSKTPEELDTILTNIIENNNKEIGNV